MENILGRVLDAFQVRMASLLGSSLSKDLAENTALALQMAAEPAALLATYPQAFFVGKANETMEGFVKAVAQAGFGSGDDTSKTAVLAQLAQVCRLTATPSSAHCPLPLPPSQTPPPLLNPVHPSLPRAPPPPPPPFPLPARQREAWEAIPRCHEQHCHHLLALLPSAFNPVPDQMMILCRCKHKQ